MSYAERKARLSKKDIARLSKWAAQKPNAADEAAKVTQQRRDLWDALNPFVTERGGAITSVKYQNPIRLEIDPESKLPDRLRELGHDLIFCEQTTRI